jgi:oligopeptide transport system ATP-binding protein
MTTPVLEVHNLTVRFPSDAGHVQAVTDVSFSLHRGETLALVGESGSGKSVTSLAILRLTPDPPLCTATGRVLLHSPSGEPRELLSLPEPEMRDLRGSRIAMIFQEPMTALNPVLTIGEQLMEPLVFHRGMSRRDAGVTAETLTTQVGIPEPRRRLASYPHQLSGGMRQRAMIAMALACDPDVLIADEPTTALDVTVQAQVLELLKQLQQRTGMAMIFVTHNLGVVADIADRVLVMYAGRVVEAAPREALFANPIMPYTRGLLDSVPELIPSASRQPLRTIPGSVPPPTELPPGCAFAPRCDWVEPGRCDLAVPPLEPAATQHWVRCVRWRECCAP